MQYFVQAWPINCKYSEPKLGIMTSDLPAWSNVVKYQLRESQHFMFRVRKLPLALIPHLLVGQKYFLINQPLILNS